jgi:hypothetical protein
MNNTFADIGVASCNDFETPSQTGQVGQFVVE